MNDPKDIKAFYMRVNDDGRAIAAMDMLSPRAIGEIVGGRARVPGTPRWRARVLRKHPRLPALRSPRSGSKVERRRPPRRKEQGRRSVGCRGPPSSRPPGYNPATTIRAREAIHGYATRHFA